MTLVKPNRAAPEAMERIRGEMMALLRSVKPDAELPAS